MKRGLQLLVCLVTSTHCFAQNTFSYTTPASVYIQNFDGLPAAGSFSFIGKGLFNLAAPPVNGSNMNGWQMLMTNGSGSSAVFGVSTGSSAGNGVYSFGAIGSPDRALGSLAASSGVYAFGLVIANNTGSLLNSVTISFTTEQWRKGGSGNRNTWLFRYRTGGFSSIDQPYLMDEPALNMMSVQTSASAAALNGNLPENQQFISFTIRNIIWKNGEQLLLRWDDADEQGSDDACAIDNFSFSAKKETSAPSVAISSATNITSTSAVLNGFVHDHFARTTVVFEYDTSNRFLHPLLLRANPDTIEEGSGNTAITASANGLITGTTYFFHIHASNSIAGVVSNYDSFTTTITAPVLTTDTLFSITPYSAILRGRINSSGGASIIEKGIVWSTIPSPSVSDNKIITTTDENQFSQLITGLPSATTIYARSFATNRAGTGYGNVRTFITPTTLITLANAGAILTNANTINFSGKTAQPITSLSAADFEFLTTGVTGASITGVSLSANTFTVTINTGTGDGTIGLIMVRTSGSAIPVFNLPFIAAGLYTIDKTPPVIRGISIRDTLAKIGDTIPVFINVKPDTTVYRLIAGKINGITVYGFGKLNDSSYTCKFIIPSGAADVPIGSSIPLSLTISDAAENRISYTQPLLQNGAVDANKPFITSIRLPADKLYKASDTLEFVLHFNERVNVTATAAGAGFSITVGSRTKLVAYSNGSGTDSIVARYVIQPGETDKDGIRFVGPVNWLNGEIKDMAGNTAVLTATIPATKNILIDAIAPVVSGVDMPLSGVYRNGNILDFVVNFSEKVGVSGIPLLPVIIGSQIRYARYTSGSGGNSILFRYTVQADDLAKDGIKCGPSLLLSSSFITDEAGNPALVVLNNTALINALINPPTVSAIALTLPANSWYKANDTLVLQLAFNEKVFVRTGGGLPALKLTIGNATRQAHYVAGSGSSQLLFAYIVQPGELDTNGIQLSNTIWFNGGAIEDARGNPVPSAIPLIPSAAGILIDAANPAVKSVITPPKNVYHEGDTLLFMISFTEKLVLVPDANIPYIGLRIGAQQQQAVYQDGSGSALFLFRYIVQPGDLDKNGIKLDSIIYTGNDLLRDAAGNYLLPSLKNIGALSGVKIDAVAPYFTVNISDTVLCENATPVNISALLSLTNEEGDEDLSWKISVSLHGSVSRSLFSTTSNGNAQNPPPLFYQPAAGFYGIDTVVCEVSDGFHRARKKINFIIQPAIGNNMIRGPQQSCINSEAAPIKGSLPSGGNGTYTAKWESSTLSDTSGFMPLLNAAGLNEYAPDKINVNTWFRRTVRSGACSANSKAIKIDVIKSGFWTGQYDNNWNNPNNWCGNIVPAAFTDVTVDGDKKFAPVIADSARCNNLSLQNNAQLTIKSIFQIGGTIAGTDGSIDASLATFIFNGNIQQLLPAVFKSATIANLVLDNPAGLVVQSPISVGTQINLRRGILFTNDQLQLLPASRVGACAPGTGISGNLRIAHRIPGGRRAFRLIGHPFNTDLPLDILTDSIDITGEGGAANGFTTTMTNEPSSFYRGPLKTSDTTGIDTGWTAFRNTHGNAPDIWKKNNGIRLLIRGRKGQGLDGTPAGDGTNGTYYPDAVTVQFTGPVYTGDLEMRLPEDNRVSYQVIANPYASAIEMSNIARGIGISCNYWLWDPCLGKAGGYSCVPFNMLHTLPSFGAFIIRSAGDANSRLLFTENCKAIEDTVKKNPDPMANNFLRLQLEKDSLIYDRFLLIGLDSTRSYFDASDGEKLMNEELNLYSISRDYKMLSVDARPVTNESIIPLGLQASLKGQCRIRITGYHFTTGNTLQLHDKYLKRWIALEKDSSYLFNITTDTASYGNNRFELSRWRKTEPDTGVQYKLVVNVVPQPAHDQVLVQFSAPEAAEVMMHLIDLRGNNIATYKPGYQKSGQLIIPLSGLTPGLYFLQLSSGAHTTTQKIIKQ